MHLDHFQIGLLLGGLAFGTFGALVVFSNRFLGLLERTVWTKRTKVDELLFPRNSARIFNRYGTGLGCLILGAGMLILLLQTVWK
jgi:hypothetical protein